MLLKLRQKSSSWILRILFLLLILSFGAFGLNDFAGRVAADSAVATVGEVEISRVMLDRELGFDMRRFQQLTGQAISRQEARDFGLQDVALNRLINRALLDQTTADLGIAVSDSVVAGRIRSDPTFARGEVFDPVLFQQFLQFSLGMSEDAFVEELRADLARSYVESAIASGGRPPADLAEKLFAHRFEARSLDWLTVATAAMPDPGSPSPGDLEAFYQNNSARYARPVTRQVTWLHIDPNVLADRIIIPPDEIRAAYEAASGRYIQPEQRRLSQIVLSDEATAREVAARVAAGVSLADAAPDSAAPADLGWVGRGDLPTELSDAAFAGDAGSVAGPVESAFGWHVIQVNDVEPGRITPFEEAQAEIGRILAHDRAVEQAITMIEQVEDALAGGASLEQVATDIGLATDGLAAIDPDGRDGDGNPLDVPPVREFVAEVFAEQPGETSAALDTADGGFLVFRVGSETPATTRPLADVRTAVADAWRQRQRLAAASDLADTIVAAAAGGRSLSTLALEHGLSLAQVNGVTRATTDSDIPGPLLVAAFDAPVGEAVLAPVAGGFAVVVANGRQPGSSAASPDLFAQFRQQVNRTMGNDLLSQYMEGLRQRFAVEVNRQALDREALAPATGHGF